VTKIHCEIVKLAEGTGFVVAVDNDVEQMLESHDVLPIASNDDLAKLDKKSFEGIIIISFMEGIRTYIPETNYLARPVNGAYNAVFNIKLFVLLH
jgi:hypothetical protein